MDTYDECPLVSDNIVEIMKWLPECDRISHRLVSPVWRHCIDSMAVRARPLYFLKKQQYLSFIIQIGRSAEDRRYRPRFMKVLRYICRCGTAGMLRFLLTKHPTLCLKNVWKLITDDSNHRMLKMLKVVMETTSKTYGGIREAVAINDMEFIYMYLTMFKPLQILEDHYLYASALPLDRAVICTTRLLNFNVASIISRGHFNSIYKRHPTVAHSIAHLIRVYQVNDIIRDYANDKLLYDILYPIDVKHKETIVAERVERERLHRASVEAHVRRAAREREDELAREAERACQMKIRRDAERARDDQINTLYGEQFERVKIAIAIAVARRFNTPTPVNFNITAANMIYIDWTRRWSIKTEMIYRVLTVTRIYNI